MFECVCTSPARRALLTRRASFTDYLFKPYPALPLPFYSLRHGIALLLTYKCGSLRMPESQLYRVPLRWLGVRPLQILQRFDLPDDAFQYFSEGDASKCRSLMASPFCQSHPRWQEEVEAMVRFLFLF